MTAFKTGDAARLKSGGPKMTVCVETSRGIAPAFLICHWFAGDTLQKGEFDPAELDRLEPVEAIG